MATATGYGIEMPGTANPNNGLGNIYWIENYILAAGITNSTHQAALRALFFSMKDAGMQYDFDALRINFGTAAAQDRENLASPTLYPATTLYPASYVNDATGAHTLQGYQNVTSPARYAQSTIVVPSITNIHLHAYNNSPETSGAVTRFLVGVKDVANGNDLNWSLMRNNNQVTSGRLGIGSTGTSQIVSSAAGYDVTKTGLLTIAKVGTTHTLYDDGSQIAQKTGVADPVVVNPTLTMSEGSITGTPASTSATKLFLYAIGFTAWTAAKELAFRNIINTFKTAIGA